MQAIGETLRIVAEGRAFGTEINRAVIPALDRDNGIAETNFAQGFAPARARW